MTNVLFIHIYVYLTLNLYLGNIWEFYYTAPLKILSICAKKKK